MLPVSGRFHGIIVFQMILKCGKSFVIVEDWALSWCHSAKYLFWGDIDIRFRCLDI